MVEKVLGTSGDETLTIMAQRIKWFEAKAKKPCHEEFMKLEETEEILTKENEKGMKEDIKKARTAMEQGHEWEEEYFQRARALREAEDEQLEGQNRGGGGRKPWGHKKYPARAPQLLTQPEARKLIPPGSRIWNIRWMDGWGGHCPPWKRIHAPADKEFVESNLAACYEVIKRLWKQWLRLRGVPPDRRPIEFPELEKRAQPKGKGKGKRKRERNNENSQQESQGSQE